MAVAVLLLFIHQASLMDFSRVLGAIASIGLMLLLVLVPGTLMTLADTVGLSALVTGLPRRLWLSYDLISIRLGGDALCNSLPGGVAVGETVRSVLLQRCCGADLPRGIAVSVIAKATMALAQAIFIVGGLSIAGIAGDMSPLFRLLPGAERTVLLLSVGFCVLVCLVPLGYQLIDGRITSGGKGRGSLFAGFLAKIFPLLQATCLRMKEITLSHRSRIWPSVMMFLAGWICIGGESFIILRLLRVPVTFTQAVVFEAVISLIRLAFFFVPSALGAQEVGMIAFVTALGAPDPLTLAGSYVALKRSRELAWIGLGYASLLLGKAGFVIRTAPRTRGDERSTKGGRHCEPVQGRFKRRPQGRDGVSELSPGLGG
jgi:hypothetical protein